MTTFAPLFNTSLTFATAASQLRTAFSGTDEFHFLVRLLDFLTSPDPVKDLDIPDSFAPQDWVYARMKAEWCLWDGYAKWDLGLNPFLGHFVETWGARYARDELTSDTIVVGIILSGQAKEVLSLRRRSFLFVFRDWGFNGKLANMTCEEIQNNAPRLEILEEAISMQKLHLALLQQEYAPNHPLISNHPSSRAQTGEFAGATSDFGSDRVTIGDGASVLSLSVNTKSLTSFKIQGGMSVPSSPAPMSRSSSLNPSAFEREHYVRQILSKGLEKASCTALTADESSTLNEMISKYPDTTLELLEPDIQSFAGTIEFNPIIFRDKILPLLLSSRLREESPLFSPFNVLGLMSRTYSTLTFLPPTLPVLETLSLLISAKPEILLDQSSQSSRLVHEFLANAGRQLEALSENQGERDKTSRQVRLVPSPPKTYERLIVRCVYF